MSERNTPKYECLCCGAPVKQEAGKRRRIYCNRKCHDRYYYITTPNEREKRRQELAAEVVISPLKEALECQYCGKTFEDYARKNRKYCSRECSDAAHSYNSEGHRAQFSQMPFSKEIRETALRLHEEGKTAYAISKLLGCTNGRVAAWIKRERKKAANPEHCREWPEPYFRYIYANNAEVWVEVLRDEMRMSGFSPIGNNANAVSLTCGTMNIHKGADHLAAIVTERLKLDVYDGKYYAFCNDDRDKLRILRWDGSGFQMMTRRRERGRYIWPPARFGMTINVAAEEFEFIMLGSQNNVKLL
jgi:hypothetical protein